MSATVAVHADLPDGRTTQVGLLDAETNAGGALVSTLFRYADPYLSDPASYSLCPELPLSRTPVRLTGLRILPGAVADTPELTYINSTLVEAMRGLRDPREP